MEERESFVAPFHMDAVVVIDTSSTVFPFSSNAALSIWLSKSALIALNEWLAHGSGVEKAPHIPSFFVLLLTHS